MSDPDLIDFSSLTPEQWKKREIDRIERYRMYEEEIERRQKEQKILAQNKIIFIDDPNSSPNNRVANFRNYLISIDWETRNMGSIDQTVANWAMENGFPEAAF
uniref:Uncharacterized protein n=1 Tax=viral metagenome TaxID=1070528 RepID=A0A6C0ANX8_9ZZZZ